MKVTGQDPQVSDYLATLDRALRDLPRARREETLREIRAHIDDAVAETDGTPTAVASVLDSVGDPREIADAAYAESPRSRPAPRLPAVDVIAVILVLVGGVILPFVGWVIGVVLLWISRSWSTRDKLIGTLLPPGGLLAVAASPFVAFSTSSGQVCSTPAMPVPDSLGSSGAIPAVEAVPTDIASCTTTSSGGLPPAVGITLMVLLVVLPFVTTWWLLRTARRTSAYDD